MISLRLLEVPVLEHAVTCHAAIRMRQRGLRDADLQLILSSATQIAPDAYLLTRADSAREITRRKREIQQLERLNGCKVVVDGGTVLTCYYSSDRDQRMTIRKGRDTQ
jgi:hypothetical protein